MAVKATVQIDDEIMSQARELVRTKRVKSFNALVENALRGEIQAMRAAEIKAAIREAANDPLFLADLEETATDFSWTDSEEKGDNA